MAKCERCGGSGFITYEDDPSGLPGRFLMTFTEPCPDCLDKGLCPECGTALAWDDKCPGCGWVDIEGEEIDNLVDAVCPDCGEARADYLEIADDKTTCASCGAVYEV